MRDALPDRATLLASIVAAVATAFLLFWILLEVLVDGAPRLSLGFLAEAPADAGRSGGIAPIIISTILILAVCMTISIPLGLGAALFLSQLGRRRRRAKQALRRSLDMLASMPSIVFGLFGSVLFCEVLGLGFSILSGGLTLACMVLPILIRSAEAGFRSVPSELRRGAVALGLSEVATLRHVVLPLAAPGVVVGLVLGVGRALAETAALIFTSGYVDRMPSSLFDSGRSLSIHIYDLSMNVPGGDRNAYATAFVLILLLLAINTTVEVITHRWLGRGIFR